MFPASWLVDDELSKLECWHKCAQHRRFGNATSRDTRESEYYLPQQEE
jgi:hypothetical protein